jgi:BirA family biotin operon repressor/biotin-[acetyl-CoA-carboxylase] ligase
MDTLFIGKNTIFLPRTSSTNSHAIELLKNVNPPEGTVIHAYEQTEGKGQRGNRWEAQPGLNITASVILKPAFLPINKRFFLYQVVALACHDALSEILNDGQIDIKIKWPNDILVNGKKIAGILIENYIQNNVINWCVAGLGVNVNQRHFGELEKATSVNLITGKTVDIQHVMQAICAHLEKYYLALKNDHFDFVSQQYLDCLYGLNAKLNFEYAEKIVTFTVRGVSAEGLLLLEDENSKRVEADVKELKWRY